MSEFKFSCQHCDQHIQCDECLSGTEIECPSCRKLIVVPLSPRLLETSPGPARALVPPVPLIDATEMPTVHDATLSFSVATVKGEIRPVITAAGQEEIRAAFGTGRVLQDRYVLERELGRGGMGQVYLALDRRLSRHVAIKVMLPTIEGDQGDPKTPSHASLNEAFAEEARLGANLTHPAIAPVFDFGFHEGKPFTVFEYIPGETLQDLLRRRKRLPLDDVRLILAPLAQALDFAHSQHVVHRDLKPANIRATAQGQFKILDLGLAKEFRRHVDWAAFAGTPAYASPEQAAGLASDGRTDQYALALIAYEMLTGQRPFQSRDPMELLRVHREQEPPSPQTIAPELPESVCSALMRALRKEPNERFGTCEEFAVAMGCQFLSTPAVMPEIILEGDAKWQVGLWKVGGARLRMHLVLSADALWCDQRTAVFHWPVDAITKIKRSRGNKELHFVTPSGEGTTLQRIRFSKAKECQQWYERLCSLKASLESSPSREKGATLQKFVVLLRRPPSVRYQLLGPVEVKCKKRWSGESALRIRGAMTGADAVVDIQEELVPGFGKTVRRLSGTAVRSVDQSGTVELRSRWFNEQVKQVTTWMLWMLTISFVLVMAQVAATSGLWGAPSQGNSTSFWTTIRLSALVSTGPLVIAILLRLLKWPQLMPAAVIGLLAFGFTLVPVAIGNIAAGQLLMVLLDPGNLLRMFFASFVAAKTWQAYREFRLVVPEAEQYSSVGRTTLGRLTTATSLVGAIALAIYLAWSGYIFGRIRTIEARQRSRPAPQRYLVLDLSAGGTKAMPENPQRVQALIDGLRDRSAAIRAWAAASLATNGADAKAAIPALISLLKDKAPNPRVNAAFALLKIGVDKSAISPLRGALMDRDERVRRNAAGALANMGPEGKDAIPALVPLLKDHFVEARVNAALALERIGADKTAVPSLIEALSDTDARVRQYAAGALASVGPEAKAAIPVLIPLLKDTLVEARVNAGFALLRIGADKTAVAPLIAALSDRDGRTRQNAAATLANLGAEATSAIPALTPLLKDTLAGVRVAASLALLKIGADKTAVPSLIEALSDTDARVRQSAAGALADVGPEAKAAISSLIPLLKDSLTDVRVNAVAALWQIGADKTAVPALIGALGDADARVRQRAAFALSRIGAEAKPAVSSLLPLLKDNVARVRMNAASALVQIGADKTSAPALIAALLDGLSNEDAQTRLSSAVSLGRMGSEAMPAVPKLIEALKDSRSITNRQSAMTALGQLGRFGRDAVPALMETLGDPDANVRRAAANTLGNIGSEAKEALPRLTEALNDNVVQNRATAAIALKRIDPQTQIPLPMLMAALKSEQSSDRIAAAMALGQFGREASNAVPALIKTLDDPDANVRRLAALALGQTGPGAKAAIPNLIKLLSDTNMQEHAIAAVAQISPENKDVVSAVTILLIDPKKDVRMAATNALEKMSVERLLRQGDHAKAALAAAQIVPVQPMGLFDAGRVYNAACYLGRCVPLARKDEQLSEAERQVVAQNYADQAIKFLRQAIAAGWKNFDHMQRDTDLDALRDHPDYKALVEKLGKN